MKNERQNDLVRLLSKKRLLKNKELAKYFNVSIETIRRDINELEREGIVKKVYGGIQIISESNAMRDLESWSIRSEHCHEEKVQIVTRALELISDNSTIALDFGTTIFELSCLLSAKKNLSIITNSLRIAQELSKNTSHKVYTVGGLMLRDEMSTSGIFARDFLSNFTSIDLFICSADGISLENGMTESLEGTIDLKRYLINTANRTIGAIDHSKFGTKASYYLCPISNLDLLITDANTPRNYIEKIERSGVEVIIAP